MLVASVDARVVDDLASRLLHINLQAQPRTDKCCVMHQVEFVRVRAINLPSLPLISWLCGLLVMLATCFWSDFQAADLDSETITLQQEHLYNIHYSGRCLWLLC